MHGYGWMSDWGSGMWFGPIFMIGIPVLVIVLIVWLVQSATRSSTRADRGGSDARRILDERYARGEIDDEEYKRRRATIGD